MDRQIVSDDARASDELSTGMLILCFLLPIIGAILYIKYKGEKFPKKAKSAGIAALVGFGIGLVFTML